MLQLHTMPRVGWGLFAPSPFCAKVELYLRMADIPHTLAPTLTANRAPRGKLPWIVDDGVAVPDSERIVEHLVATRGDRLDEAGVTDVDRARHHLARRTVEESLYFAIVAERWQDPALRAAYTRDLLAGMPAPARPLVGALARRLLDKQLWQQGTGRHPLDDVIRRAGADVDAVAAVLGDAPYFGGDRPRAIDAAIFGSLANVWYTPTPTRIGAHVGRHAHVVAWLDRVRSRYAADL